MEISFFLNYRHNVEFKINLFMYDQAHMSITDNNYFADNNERGTYTERILHFKSGIEV